MSDKEKILVFGKLMLPQLKEDLEREFDVSFFNEQADPDAFLREHGQTFTGAVTSAGGRIPPEVLDRLPRVKVVSSFGVGYDHLDGEDLSARGIQAGYTPEVLNDCVADLAMALLLDVSRGISAADRYVRQGKWPSGPFALQRRASGKRLGILGMGRIGQAIAKRAAGFDMTVAYHNRNKRDDVGLEYFDTATGLAQWSDYLIVAVTGGAQTARLVGKDILDALGPDAFLINISRGTVVDEAALIEALRQKKIAGAALDVYTNEPHVPEALIDMENVVLLPHVASGTHETRRAMADLVLDNLRHFYANGKVKTQVPW